MPHDSRHFTREGRAAQSSFDYTQLVGGKVSGHVAGVGRNMK